MATETNETTSAAAAAAPARARAAKKSAATAAKAAPRSRRTAGATQTPRARKSTTTAAAAAAAATASATAPEGSRSRYAQRAVLIPVGAALIARDRVVSDIGAVISDCSSAANARARLHRFEQRGGSARSRLEREARRTRVQIERELRRRRGELHERRSALADTVTGQLLRQASSRIEQTVHGPVKAGASVAGKLQERIASLV